jgi:hypothetical protein
MPTNFGPNPDTTSLVVSLDSADIKQSYFGEPATNSHNADRASMTQVGFDAWGCYDTVGYPALPPHTWGKEQSKARVRIAGPYGQLVDAMLYHNFTGGFHGPTDWGALSQGDLTAGRTYTVQGWVKAADQASIGKSVNVHTYYGHSNGAYSDGTTYQLTNTWQLVSHTHTITYSSTGAGFIYFFTQNPSSVKMYLAMTAIVFDKSHAVAWLPGGTTRTADQALKNPVNGAFSGLSTMSFKANNNFTFDGTDDSFGVTTPQYTSARNFTFIAWVKSNGVLADGRRGIMYGSTSSGYISFFGYNGQTLLFETRDSQDSEYLGVGTSGFSIYDGTWAMVGFQIGQDSLKAFYAKTGGEVVINSNLDTRPGNFTFKDFTVGRDSSGYRWNGDIDGIKFFNRVLSETELNEYYQQNKNRFV